MKTITIYHSPDADDAFMFYGLQAGAVTVPGFEFKHDLKDIESLNHMALKGELDVTAVSVHAFAHLKDQYAILNCGASMGGENYGPRLVVKENGEKDITNIRKIAIPGELTSATLALKMYLLEESVEPELINTFFDDVQKEVKEGRVEAGLLIHEGQITAHKDQLVSILDLGKWWWEKTELPLPLGVNVVKKSLGQDGMMAVYSALKQSIEYSLNHREEALKYALQFGRGLSKDEADEFVGMYVNSTTLELGEDGRESICKFLSNAETMWLIPKKITPEFIG